MKKHFLYWLMLGFIVITGCQKELSFEVPTTPAGGSLQDDAAGDCLPKTVNGTYAVGQALVPATNTLTVQVNVTKTGAYTVFTDTVNGYYFRVTGSFTTLGNNTVTLRGNGTPFAAGTNNFVVTFDTTVCDIQVVVTSPGVGTLAGAPNACAPITVNGSYGIGVPITMTNSAAIQVNVTTAGAFSITTDTVAGVWFTFSGSLTTGAQPVILQAQGGPPSGTAGAKTFTVKLGASTCTFPVTLAAAGVGTLGGAGGACTPINVYGPYIAGTALTAADTVVVQVNVTTPGIFSISTNTINGYSFSFSGNLAASGPVTLVGAGTPIAALTDNFTVTLAGTPASTCTFSNTVTAAGVAVYTVDCASAVPDGLYEQGTQLNGSNTVDIDVNVTVIGTYNITTTATNGMTFSSGAGTFTVTGIQTVTLFGSGTPTAAGNFNIPVAPPACTFLLTVDPPLPAYHWQFTVTNAPATIYRGENDIVSYPNNPPIPGTSFLLEGSNALGSDYLGILLSDASGAINNGETYSTSAVAGNAAAFEYDYPLPLIDVFEANPSVVGASMTITVTTHDVPSKTITGTFTGTAKHAVTGQIITIASGTFTATYL